MVRGKAVSFLATTATAAAETMVFYRDVLGLDLVEDSMFALVFSDNGQMLRIQKVSEHIPPDHTVHGWAVADIGAEIALLATRGVEFSVYPGLPQSDNGVWTSPDGTKVAWFRDPVGNNLSSTEFVPNA